MRRAKPTCSRPFTCWPRCARSAASATRRSSDTSNAPSSPADSQLAKPRATSAITGRRPSANSPSTRSRSGVSPIIWARFAPLSFARRIHCWSTGRPSRAAASSTCCSRRPGPATSSCCTATLRRCARATHCSSAIRPTRRCSTASPASSSPPAKNSSLPGAISSKNSRRSSAWATAKSPPSRRTPASTTRQACAKILRWTWPSRGLANSDTARHSSGRTGTNSS